MITKSKHWVFNKKLLTLICDNYYEVDLESITDAREFTDWILQLIQKNWVEDEPLILLEFVELCEEILGRKTLLKNGETE